MGKGLGEAGIQQQVYAADHHSSHAPIRILFMFIQQISLQLPSIFHLAFSLSPLSLFLSSYSFILNQYAIYCNLYSNYIFHILMLSVAVGAPFNILIIVFVFRFHYL